MKFNGSFGDWLKQRRKALDLTQRELADQVSCSVVTIRKIESDVGRPSKQIAERLADGLAISLDDRATFVSFARQTTDQLPALPVDLTAERRANNLPQQMTPFIGRAGELAHLAERLADPTCRLLTVVGPGGIGKTRLALEAANQNSADFAHGAHFVSLAPVNSADSLIFAIGSALKFTFYGQEPPAVQLQNYLRERALLLVLDNFEHLLAGTPLLIDLLASAPHLKLLVTSRERLNVQVEWVLPIDGMDYPRIGENDPIEQSGAVQLFVQSARRIQAGFSLSKDERSVLRICQLVEGMPLGILLAAAWVGALSIHEIAREIQESLNFLETDQCDLPERQRSLRAAFDHSWKLLTEQERGVFKNLSVFRGGFAREAAQQVAGASLKVLMALVNKSFLRHEHTTGRYDIHELLRQYGAAQLNASPHECEHIHDLHCTFYADYMQRQLKAQTSSRQVAVVSEIDAEFNNVLEAWNAAVDKRKANIFRAMAVSLWYFCDLRTPHPEAADLFRRAAEALQSLPLEAETEIALGLMLALQAYFSTEPVSLALQAKALLDTSLVILRRHVCPEEMVVALVCLANTASNVLGQYAEGEQAVREGLRIAQDKHTPWGLGPCLIQLGMAVQAQGDFVQARQLAEESLRLSQATGDVYLMANAVGMLGEVAMNLGDYAEAERQLEQALRHYKELETGLPWHTAETCSDLGKVALLNQDYEKAKSWLQQSLAYHEKTGRREREYYEALYDVSSLFAAQGSQKDAVEFLSVLQSQTPHHYIRDMATAFLADLRVAMSEEVYTAAFERGRSHDLDSVVAEFLAT